MARAVIVAIVACVFSSTLDAQRGHASNPCVARGAAGEPTLRPIDEASRRPDFLEFRRRLRDVVARRDERALLASVHPNVRISFGDSGGIQAFRKEVVESSNEDFWGEFATILRLGGRFRTEDAFDAPYTFSTWPHDLDAFERGLTVWNGSQPPATLCYGCGQETQETARNRFLTHMPAPRHQHPLIRRATHLLP